ncbi:MAG: LemA family protein [Gammaproteobacteria bacterium]|nr:LemA family protein [Gammaproteobacteria bacterium]
MLTFIVVIALLGLLIISTIVIYNGLIAMIEAVRNNERQIDIQLDRRYKVFESLINVVKNYMDYEKSTLKDVVALRNQSLTAKAQGDATASMAAETKISGILAGLNVVFEQYPDLKANQNALQLQEEISNTENKLAYSKQAYNDSIERYNARKKSVFPSIVVSIFPSKLNFTFPYWHLEKGTIKEREDYSVKM